MNEAELRSLERASRRDLVCRTSTSAPCQVQAGSYDIRAIVYRDKNAKASGRCFKLLTIGVANLLPLGIIIVQSLYSLT